MDSALVRIYCVCPMCNKDYFIEASSYEYELWKSGELIQNALVSLTSAERESLISNLCPICQFLVFNEANEC